VPHQRCACVGLGGQASLIADLAEAPSHGAADDGIDDVGRNEATRYKCLHHSALRVLRERGTRASCSKCVLAS
jgi:hypothetical protein